jgi:hypothetical protein
MKTAEQFWRVISAYNEATIFAQAALCLLILASVALAAKRNLHVLPRISLSSSCMFVGIVFFFVYDRSATALWFAGPLFVLIGLLFALDAFKNARAEFMPFTAGAYAMCALVLAYPLASRLLGHTYPGQVLYILPCPLVSLGIVIYARYRERLLVLELLMILWAVTGLPKAFIFDVHEDLILFAAGLYGMYIAFTGRKRKSDPTPI